MTDRRMTAEQFSARAQRALERFMNHLAAMSIDDLAALSTGVRVSVALCMEAGDLDSAGCFDALAELVDALKAARAAMEENQR